MPLFMGGVAPTVPPQSIAENFNSGQKKGLTMFREPSIGRYYQDAPRSPARAFAPGLRAGPTSPSSAVSVRPAPH